MATVSVWVAVANTITVKNESFNAIGICGYYSDEQKENFVDDSIIYED
jgi:hypothetical protein